MEETPTHCYRLTDTGADHAMLLTHVHTRLLQPGLAQLTDADPRAPSPLRTAVPNTGKPSINKPWMPDSPHDTKLTRSSRLRRPQLRSATGMCQA
jgi:hypothetical protein